MIPIFLRHSRVLVEISPKWRRKYFHTCCLRLQQVFVEEKVYRHVPVMKEEVLQILQPKDNQVFIDMTFGAGGHTKSILDSAKNVKIFCLDRDETAYKLAQDQEASEQYRGRLTPMLGKFSDLGTLLAEHGIRGNTIDGILFDLGCSSMQFDDPSRGFGLSSNGPLDMRMDGTRITTQPTAADVIQSLDEDDLYKIFKIYGEEKAARPIARALVEARYTLQSVKTTKELADIIAAAHDRDFHLDALQRSAHSATKAFQALRIFVNNELNELNHGLELAYHYLRPGGCAVALSFHSLEDRIVKRHFMDIDLNEPFNMSMMQKYRNCAKWHSASEMEDLLTKKKWTPINKKVVTPSDTEVDKNPRSRSAKLRAAVKD